MVELQSLSLPLSRDTAQAVTMTALCYRCECQRETSLTFMAARWQAGGQTETNLDIFFQNYYIIYQDTPELLILMGLGLKT